MKNQFISVCEPKLNKNTRKYVLDCLKTEWISSSGSYIDLFEKKWGDYCKKKHAVSVTSGTAALIIALKSLELKSGDEVILPSFTIISCVIAVLEAGGKPVLVDCDLSTWCMIPNEIEKKITKKTKAILVVHMFGHPADMDKINQVVQGKKIFIIEDAAEAIGSSLKEKSLVIYWKIIDFCDFLG